MKDFLLDVAEAHLQAQAILHQTAQNLTEIQEKDITSK